jgi:hypothetical protein
MVSSWLSQARTLNLKLVLKTLVTLEKVKRANLTLFIVFPVETITKLSLLRSQKPSIALNKKT